MLNQMVIEMLVRKILSSEINPNTNNPFKVEDIKIDEYKNEVEKRLVTQ